MARSKSTSKSKTPASLNKRPPIPKRPSNSKKPRVNSPKSSGSQTEKTATPELSTLLAAALRDQSFLRLVLSQPLVKTENAIAKVGVRVVEVQGETRYQWTVRQNAKELHENLTLNELLQRTQSVFGTNLGDAHLFTTEADLTVRWNYGKPQKIKRKPPTLQATADSGHNRQKQYLIPIGVPCPFLIEIGVMLPNGQVRPTMYNKFRQINRYLEFVEDLLPELPASGPIRIVDFGCGKSYLTFALHHLLTVVHQRDVALVGLDVKADVIEDCTRIAKALNCIGLEFRIGRIETFEPAEQVHLAVSLHACDTATDDALAAALRWKCDAILAVPCCQHELCQTIGRQTLPGLTEYGILKERFASLATDALRAQFLELQGYRTQVVEFIETEHTPKNLLIRAVRRKETSNPDQNARKLAYDGLKQVLGITDWHLERVTAATVQR